MKTLTPKKLKTQLDAISTLINLEVKLLVIEAGEGKRINLLRFGLPAIDIVGNRMQAEEIYFVEGGVILQKGGIVVVVGSDEHGGRMEVQFNEIPIDERITIYEALYGHE